MGIILDLILLAIVVIAGILGYKKGAIAVVLDIVILIILIPIVIWLRTPVNNYVMDHTKLGKDVEKSITKQLKEKGVTEEKQIEFKGFKPLEKKVNEIVDNIKKEQYSNFTEQLAKELSKVVVNAIVTIALAIAIYIILKIVQRVVVNIVDIIPLVSFINDVAGSVIEILKVLLIIFVLLYLLQFVLPLLNNSSVLDKIEKTRVLKYMYQNNLVSKVISK